MAVPDIVLIGNGPSATSLDVGDLIDSFRAVVRFNDFVIDGWERQLGRKTTHWAANDLMSPDKHQDLSAIVAVPERNRRRLKASDWHARPKPTNIVPPAIERGLTAKFGRPGENGRRWASTGVLVVAYLIGVHGAVALHGFDCFLGSGHHYFAGSKADARVHVGSWEESVFKFWLRSNKAVLLSQLQTEKS